MKTVLVPALMTFALAGCLQSSPAMMRLQSACQAGNLGACETVADHERTRRHALVDALTTPVAPVLAPIQPLPGLAGPIYPAPANPAPTHTMHTTLCRPIGNMVRCTRF